MIYQLNDDDIGFPDPREMPEDWREDDGCYAVGGDLSPERLLQAYSWGIFPWSAYKLESIYWYCPMRRFVIFPDKVHVSHSMRNLINKNIYTVTYNTDFEAVIRGCANANNRIDQPGAWLGEKMIQAYLEMHRLGWCRSVEVWRDGRLVGGFYGEVFNHVFVGESMFSLEPNTSKLALITLCHCAGRLGLKLVDCQLHTPHLESLGGEFIPYDRYLRILWDEE